MASSRAVHRPSCREAEKKEGAHNNVIEPEWFIRLELPIFTVQIINIGFDLHGYSLVLNRLNIIHI